MTMKKVETRFKGKMQDVESRFKRNPNRGTFKDIPEWSYLDGSPKPPGMKLTRRRERQKEICRRIIELSKEIEQVQNKESKLERRRRHKNL